MDKLFEPGAVELADPRGDPNRVIEVQQKIEELLGANRQRQQGIKHELLQQGAWALPGMMNATYVWMNSLDKSPPDQELLASLMAQLAAGNPAAADLLFRHGVLETPFPTPRAIAQKALGMIAWEPTEDNRRDLRDRIDYYLGLEDARSVIDLYTVLLKSGQEEDYGKSLTLCKSWARKSWEPAGELLSLLSRAFPERVPETLSAVFLAVRDKYKDKNIANMLLDPLRPIPVSWLENEFILKISRDVLPNTSPGRHTAVEYLWVHAVSDCKEKDPGLWKNIFGELENRVKNEGNETVYRYWFEAVGKADEINYVVHQATANAVDERWAIKAVVQLFFLERYQRQAAQALRDLESEQSVRYERASNEYESITGSPGKTKREIDEERKIGHLR